MDIVTISTAGYIYPYWPAVEMVTVCTQMHTQVQSMQHVVDQFEATTATAGHYNEGNLMSEILELLDRYHIVRGPVWIDMARGLYGNGLYGKHIYPSAPYRPLDIVLDAPCIIGYMRYHIDRGPVQCMCNCMCLRTRNDKHIHTYRS